MVGTDAAEEKFWRLPELVAHLLPYLDAYSIARLASVHQLTTEILLGDPGNGIMRKVIRESGLPSNLLNEETLDQNREGLQRLAKLLLKMKKPKELLSELLEVICARCQAPNSLKNCVRVSCKTPGHISHSVSAIGFVLLEEVEGVFGSVEQKVLEISPPSLKNPWLPALGSRVWRQEGMLVKLKMKDVECRTPHDTRALHTLVQKSPEVEFAPRPSVRVLRRVGGEGWSYLAEAIKNFPDVSLRLTTYKHILQEAKQEDLRTIWESSDMLTWIVMARHEGVIQIIKNSGCSPEENEQAWSRLVQILDE